MTSPTQQQSATFAQRQAAYSTRRTKTEMMEKVPLFANWDYTNWRLIWLAIRHAMIGEVEIKRHGVSYLPQPEGMNSSQYDAYLDRAVFYNMVYRTVTGLTGSIFRRDPRLLGAGPKLIELAKSISNEGLSLKVFAKVASQEMLSVGRYGVLADKPASDDILAKPYLAGYTCENILDWTSVNIDGRFEYDYILLREFVVDRRMFQFEGSEAKPNTSYGQLFTVYRVLRLTFNEYENRWEYYQEVYRRDHEDATLTETPEITMPMVYGVPMKRIPFRFFNATTNLPDIEKPPILDILTLNLSHYKTYAQLEHGRFFTANPVYYVSGGQEEDEYHIGPSVVWEIGTGEKAGLIEFNGQGLKSLEDGLEQKETQVASLGGRLIGDSTTAGQSDNQVALKDRNEQSLLLNVTTVINENFTYLLDIIGQWINEQSTEKMEFRVNQDFLLNQSAAREFRAVTMMYQAGMLPIEVIYEYFLKADVIPEYVTLEVFTKMLDDAKQFPHNPDFESRGEGFSDATQQRNDELQRYIVDTETEGKQTIQETKNEHDAVQSEKDRKNTLSIAKQQPKIPPVPAQGRMAMQKSAAKPTKPAADSKTGTSPDASTNPSGGN